MQAVKWEIRNFVPGQHTEPARAGRGAERFARAAEGLRVDGDGHLRPRAALRRFGDVMRTAVTGVAAARNYLLALRADGTLWIRFSDDPEQEREIQFQTPFGLRGAKPLTGQLSVIGDFADFAIVKGSGGDAFWIDMREDTESYLHAFKLGFEPPDFYPSVRFVGPDDNRQAVILRGFMYFYRWTYVRAFGASNQQIRDGEYYREGNLFVGMESNPSPPIGFVGAENTIGIRAVVDNDGNEVTAISPVPSPRDALQFGNWQHSDDPQITGLMLYQSERVTMSADPGAPRINVDALVYRRIDYIPKPAANSFTGQSATEAGWVNRPLMRQDNDVMPETERIYLYNDRIFVPTAEGLRFSDIDGTELRFWAYPKIHAIARGGVRDLVEHRGVLLFGGPTDFYSLTGTGPFDYEVNRLGTTGPISAHAMNVFRESVAFVGAAGLYATDGGGVQKLSDALDRDFEDYQVSSGHCHMLPDDTWLFVVNQTQEEGRPRGLVYHFDDGWFQWPRLSVRQLARWEAGGVRVMVADESRALRTLLWNHTDNASDDDSAFVVDFIEWSWESERLNFGDERLKRFMEFQIEGEALSVVPQSEARWGLTLGSETLENAFAFRVGTQVFGLRDLLWGSSSVASRVRLTVWVDDTAPQYEVFELRGKRYRPFRVRLNRRGKSIRVRLEGRGHVHLRALAITGGR